MLYLKKDIWLTFERYLFYVFVFCIPFQTRVFLGEWGEPKDEFYSAFFYLTDALVIALLTSWFLRILFLGSDGGPTGFVKKIFSRTQNKLLLLFLVFVFLSVFRHEFYGFGFYHFLKFVEFVFIFLYTSSNIRMLGFRKTLAVFVFSGLFQSFLAIYQFFSQGSLGLKYLGETFLSPALDGVAKVDTPYGKMMRPYGTFTHPNVLSAFLFLCISFFYYLVVSKARRLNISNMYIFLVLISALFLTFSRGAWVVFATFSFILFVKLTKNLDIKKMFFSGVFIFALFAVLFSSLFMSRATISSDDAGLNFRHIYENTAFGFLKSDAAFGVGVGNFVNRSKESGMFGSDTWAYQPVHNFYLLMASEIGLFGFAAFMAFLVSVLGIIRSSGEKSAFKLLFLGISFSIFLLFLNDHYFWDLQQGALMLWFFLGIAAGMSESPDNS